MTLRGIGFIALLLLLALAMQPRVVTAAGAAKGPVLMAKKVAPNVFLFQGNAGVASQENRGFNSNACSRLFRGCSI